MGLFERFLSVWVSLAIILGVLIGMIIPEQIKNIALLEVAHINIPVAILIWLMIYPMMIQIDWEAIKDVGKKPQGLFLTLVINWLIKPFSMALIGWLFFNFVFESWVEPQAAKEYISGMILLGVAPCTAMVFVWSQLVRGNPNYTLVQVSVNDIVMIFAFVPIANFLLGINQIEIPLATLFYSTVLYIILPFVFGVLTRKALLDKQKSVSDFCLKMKPFSILSLLLTVVLLFAFQAEVILQQPFIIILIAIPLLVQTYGIFFLGYFSARILKLPKDITGPACLIGTSNFF